MPLPTIVTPTFELTLPSNGKKIKYRPFLVKEEKILILAIESNSMKDISRSIKDVLKNCILTKGVKIDDLPTFDIEYLFLNIRARSVGESIDLLITCPDDGETKVESKIYIDEIEVKKDDSHNPDILKIRTIVLISYHHVLIWFLVKRKHGKLRIVLKRNL